MTLEWVSWFINQPASTGPGAIDFYIARSQRRVEGRPFFPGFHLRRMSRN